MVLLFVHEKRRFWRYLLVFASKYLLTSIKAQQHLSTYLNGLVAITVGSRLRNTRWLAHSNEETTKCLSCVRTAFSLLNALAEDMRTYGILLWLLRYTWKELLPFLCNLKTAADNGDVLIVRALFKDLIPEYIPEKKVADLVYNKQQQSDKFDQKISNNWSYLSL